MPFGLTTGRTRTTGAAVIGFLATAALIGWLYLAHFWLRSPFVPFDITDAIIRLTPGRIATAGIEAFGAGAKHLLMGLGVALTLAVGSGCSALAAWAARDPAVGQSSRDRRWLLWPVVALVALALTVPVEAVIDWNGAPTGRSLTVLSVSYAVWAGVVVAGVDAAGEGSGKRRLIAGTAHSRVPFGLPDSAGDLPAPILGDDLPEQANPAGRAAVATGRQAGVRFGRRGFLFWFASGSLATALAGIFAGSALQASSTIGVRPLPLPAPGQPPDAASGQVPESGRTATLAGGDRLPVSPAPATAAPIETPAGAGLFEATTAPGAPGIQATTPVKPSGAPATPVPTPTLAAGAIAQPGTPLPAFLPAPRTRANLTALADFYVVNIATRDPVSDLSAWRLTVGGLVDRPLALTYADLLRLRRIDFYGTLECISNPVAGPLIGTTQFNGVRLSDVLALAGVQPQAGALATRSLDGYTESLPLEKALDPGTVLVYGMDGLTLGQQHGYPLRLYNPNHYGMKNPKWLAALELTAAPRSGYWETRGWDEEAIVKTTTVLDTRGELRAGQGLVQLGGIAYAGWRAIEAVQVSVDGGIWQDALLDRPLSRFTWVRWRYDWRGARPGAHDITVRAVDGDGEEQTNFITPPHPDGASGWHKVHVVVTI